jgi:hypothetical protein
MTFGDADLLIRLRRQGYFRGARRVVEIGAQQAARPLLAARQDLTPVLQELFGASGAWPLPEPAAPSLSADGAETLSPQAPPTRPFWQWLGFDYAAIDVDGSPGAVPLDLNYDSIPRDWREGFDLVTNYGTTEHVCNQLNAFKVIHDLTAVGGVMIHAVPAQGMTCHGLVNYNMKFFWTLARSNGYRWLYGNFIVGETLGLHSYVVDDVAPFDPSIVERKDRPFTDAAIVVAMERLHDHEFVAPLDVNSGISAPNAELDARYWTVFHPIRAYRRSFWSRVSRRARSALRRMTH